MRASRAWARYGLGAGIATAGLAVALAASWAVLKGTDGLKESTAMKAGHAQASGAKGAVEAGGDDAAPARVSGSGGHGADASGAVAGSASGGVRTGGLQAYSEGPAGPPPAERDPVVAAVTASASSPTFVDTPVSIQVTAYNREGARLDLSGHRVTYTVVQGAGAASIDAGGRFFATRPGTYTVRVAVDGKVANEVTIVEQEALHVTVTLSNTRLSGPGQTTQVQAHVTSGAWRDEPGVTVHFSVPAGSPVQLANREAVTDVNGIAAVRLTTTGGLTKADQVTVTASIGTGKTASAVLEVYPRPAVPAGIQLYSTPNHIPSSGAILTVDVVDADGHPIQGVSLTASASGAKTQVKDNGLGTFWVFVFPDAGMTAVDVELRASGTDIVKTVHIPVWDAP